MFDETKKIHTFGILTSSLVMGLFFGILLYTGMDIDPAGIMFDVVFTFVNAVFQSPIWFVVSFVMFVISICADIWLVYERVREGSIVTLFGVFAGFFLILIQPLGIILLIISIFVAWLCAEP